MSLNPPISSVPAQAANPNEHIHRYLSSIHPLQENHTADGQRRFAREQEHGFEEVASYWAGGESSSLGQWSEVIMKRRTRAGSSPPSQNARRGIATERDIRHHESLPALAPPIRQQETRRKGKGKAREEDEMSASQTSSADRREQRRLRRVEKARIRRPPPSPIPTHQGKRHASQQDDSEASGSQRYVQPEKRRKGNTDGADLMARFEARNVMAKRLTLRPGATKGFLDKGASSGAVRPAKRAVSPLAPTRNQDWTIPWRKGSRNTSKPSEPSEYIDRPNSAPRLPPTQPVFTAPSPPKRDYLIGQLPAPGRTNSSPWPSDIMSTSSRARPPASRGSRRGASSSQPPPEFHFTFAKVPMGASPFAAVSRPRLDPNAESDGPAHPVDPRQPVGELQHAHPRPPSQPPIHHPPSHVNKLSTHLDRGLHIEALPEAPAPVSGQRTSASREVAGVGVGPEIEQPRVFIPLNVGPAESTLKKKPLIHPILHVSPLIPSQSTPHVRPCPSLPPPAGVTPSIAVRPLIHREPSPPDIPLSPPPPRLLAHPSPPRLDRLDQLFTPPPIIPHTYTDITHSPTLNSYPIIHHNRFLSPRNPFLAHSAPSTFETGISDVRQYAFDPPLPTYGGMAYSDYSQEQCIDSATAAEESLIGAYELGGVIRDEKDEEDLRNFWKDRPAAL